MRAGRSLSCLFACLTSPNLSSRLQPEEGRYVLEDLSARLPVDLSEAEQTLGCFTQNCIVVAEGELQANGVFKVGWGWMDVSGPACSWMGVACCQNGKHDGCSAGELACLTRTPQLPSPPSLKVAALGMPPPERRADSLQALQGLDFFGGEVPDERQLLDWEVR